MEPQIFYWTGKILWWVVLLTTILVAISGAIVAPLVTFYKVKRYLWRWKYAHVIGKDGLSQAEMSWALRVPEMTPPADPDEIIEWMRRVKERYEIRKRDNEI